MSSTTDIVVNGVIYSREPAQHKGYNCDKCVGHADGAICDSLSDEHCSGSYVFKVADIIHARNYSNVNPPAPKNRPPVPPAPPQKASEVPQGVKTDTGKPQYDLIPPFALEQVAICLTEGLTTHPDADNWKLVKDGQRRFRNSRLRHSEQWRMGEIFDRDNPKVRNLAAIIVNALFELEFEVNPELNKEKTA